MDKPPDVTSIQRDLKKLECEQEFLLNLMTDIKAMEKALLVEKLQLNFMLNSLLEKNKENTSIEICKIEVSNLDEVKSEQNTASLNLTVQNDIDMFFQNNTVQENSEDEDEEMM